MKQLQQQLIEEVERGTTFKVNDVKEYYMELSCVEVVYQFAYRKRMDILVKMMMKTIDMLTIKKEQELVDILSVEKVFVRSLLQMLIRSNLVEQRDGRYMLTSEGEARLAEGFFIRKTEKVHYEVHFQPMLDLYLYELGKIEKQKYICNTPFEIEGKIQSDFSEVRALEDMILLQEQEETEHEKIIVEKVLGSDKTREEKFHFIYFEIYCEEHQGIKNRAWNLHTMKWDDQIVGAIKAPLQVE